MKLALAQLRVSSRFTSATSVGSNKSKTTSDAERLACRRICRLSALRASVESCSGLEARELPPILSSLESVGAFGHG